MLFRSLFLSHLKLLFLILVVGITIYLFSEFFEKADTFVAADTNLKTILLYFLYKTPAILSTILPAVFFLATLILLCLMAKASELIALHAGGVSLFLILRYLLYISVFWAIIQLLLSQFVGAVVAEKAEELWNVEVRKTEPVDPSLENVWLTSSNWIVNIKVLYQSGEGRNITAYSLSDDGKSIKEIFISPSLQIENSNWILSSGTKNIPDQFEVSSFSSYVLPFKRDHELLFLTRPTASLQDLPLLHLKNAIDELVETGSNVEALQTALQMKISYAASLIALTFVAFALLSWKENVYICVAAGMMIAFLFYVSTMIGETLGQTGSISPFFAAWSPHIIVVSLSLLRLFSARYTRN